MAKKRGPSLPEISQVVQKAWFNIAETMRDAGTANPTNRPLAHALNDLAGFGRNGLEFKREVDAPFERQILLFLDVIQNFPDDHVMANVGGNRYTAKWLRDALSPYARDRTVVDSSLRDEILLIEQAMGITREQHDAPQLKVVEQPRRLDGGR